MACSRTFLKCPGRWPTKVRAPRAGCNGAAVGGIYTVIKTKTAVTVEEYGTDRYCLIGPYFHRKASFEVEEVEPACADMAATLGRMREHGVRIVFGRWLVEGSPNVLLFDLGSAAHRLDEWKADLWQQAGIASPPNDTDMNDAILFGYLIAWFLGEVLLQSGAWALTCSSAT